MKPEKLYRARGDGLDLQVGEWPGPGSPVLCLHGLSANLASFALIAQGLCQAHRVLAMDLRGRGLSDKPASGYSLEHHCRDILAVLDSLGLDKVALMGHSLGAYIALAFAAWHPGAVDRLVLVDGGGELSPEQWAKVGAGTGPSLERLGRVLPSLQAYLELMRPSPNYSPWNQAIEDYFRYETEEVAGGVRSRINPATIAEERANLARVRPSELYPQVRCPVLILQAIKGMLAEDDLVLPHDALQRMLKALPDARAVSLPETDHYSIVFQPNQTRDQAVLDFLASPQTV